MTSKAMTLVERLRNLVDAWPAEHQAEMTDVREAASALEAAAERIAKLEGRLEIDHCYVLGDGADLLERKEIPPDERDGFPDGIDARDETIKLLEGNYKARADLLEAAEALEPFSEIAELLDDLSDKEDYDFVPVGVLHLRRARSVLAKLRGEGTRE